MKLNDALEAIRYFGVSPMFQGSWHRLLKKLGILRRRFPQHRWDQLDLCNYLKEEFQSAPVCDLIVEERFFLSPFEPEIKTALQSIASDNNNIVDSANDIGRGVFTYYFDRQIELSFPPDWHRNPFTQGRWATESHWCDLQLFGPELGDIKDVWEISRFGWVYDLVRAYGVKPDAKYVQTFWELTEDWLDKNQPNCGVNWVSGQECAFRIMAWCFGLFAFGKLPDSTPRRLNRLLLALAVHAERIEGFIGHAVRQKTNHAMTEAAGLYTVGTLFPFFKKARQWKVLGRGVLEKEGLRQIYSDGSYVQQSMNYHRVMLQSYLWVFRLAQLNGDGFSTQLNERVLKATEFLYQVQDDDSGRVPNYGPNDGALILPLNDCDYLDYRPVLQSCWYLFKRERLYKNGPWDEDLLWLFGPEALAAPQSQKKKTSQKFSEGGYYTLRDSDSWAMIRCHSYKDRVAHVDMLHLDLWAEGENLLRDCGSYRYFAPNEPELEMYFKSIWAHNTIIVDEDSPLRLVSRFLWLPWPCAREMPLVAEAGSDCIEWQGQHFAYDRKPWQVLHTRNVKAQRNRWEITDTLSGRGKHKLELRWHLPAGARIISRTADKVYLRLYKDWCLEISEADDIEIDLSQSTKCGGWESLCYGNKQKVKTLSMKKNSSLPATFKTVVQREKVQ